VVQVESLFANIYREPDVTRHKPVVTVPFETRLVVISDDSEPEGKKSASTAKHDGWLQVRLPDKSSAWVQSGDVIADPKPLSIPESIELAKRFPAQHGEPKEADIEVRQLVQLEDFAPSEAIKRFHDLEAATKKYPA